MQEFIMVITTTDNKEKAKEIANALVREHLAACVQIIDGVESIYIWEGRIETSKEYLLFIKTRNSLYKRVENLIKTIHNYELPEVIAIPVEQGLEEYLNWVKSCTK